MSDSYSKSEGYSSFLRDAAVPSTPVCCFIIFIIIKLYNTANGITGSLFTFTFFILFIISASLTFLSYKHFIDTKKIIISSSAVILICCSIFFYLNQKIETLTSDKQLPDSICNVPIAIDEIILKRYSSEIYFKTSDMEGLDLKGLLYYQGESIFNKGDQLFIHKKINKIKSGANNRFNKYLVSRGIHFTSGITDSDITILSRNNTPIRSSIQEKLLNRIDLIFKDPASGLIKALLTGNRNYIEKKIIIEFRNSGVLHCLSASGLHVAIFASIPAFLLFPFVRRNVSIFASLLTVLFYLFITNMPVSLLRAVFMFTLFFIQSILFRDRNVFNYLMITCSIILLISPWELFNPGFQLSFSATAGILIFYKQYRRSLKSFPGIIADSLAVTLSAQLLTVPVILYHMNQINTAGIVSNIVIIPLITLIMGVSIFSIFISFISIPAAIFSGSLTGFLVKISIFITHFISGLNFNFFIYELSPLLALILLISIIPLFNYSKFHKLKFYPIAISIIMSIIYLKTDSKPEKYKYVVTDGNSRAEILEENGMGILRLDIEDDANVEQIVSKVKQMNQDLKIIELNKSNYSTLLASKILLNDYIIEEFRFNTIPFINSVFKKTIFQLEKENVSIKFNE